MGKGLETWGYHLHEELEPGVVVLEGVQVVLDGANAIPHRHVWR